MKDQISRRACFQALGAAPLAGAGSMPEAVDPPAYRNYFGDLHNHDNVGYAQGSLGRSYEIARAHLDFFAFTPHEQWYDIRKRYELNIQDKWINGFAVTRARWNEVMEMNRRFDAPGRFVVIPAFEWHSNSDGDYHCLFPSLEAELPGTMPLADLQAFARRHGCILVPHHPANRLGHRGANFATRDPQLSPVLEIFSEWGCAESDRSPYPYIRHTEGGRWTLNTLQSLLARGYRMGVVASTDDHLGYPGAYREGLAAIKASELTREAIFDALRNRRTYAVTGDRIELDFRLNGETMGRELPYVHERRIEVAVTGWDQVDRVEIFKNNQVIHRDFPMDNRPTARSWERPVLVRFEYGWGPWPALGIVRVADWAIRLAVKDGEIEAVQPCFLSGPLEEGRRDRILEQTPQAVVATSFTALRQQIDDYSQKAIVLRLRGTAATRLTLTLDAPAKVSVERSLGQLAESNEPVFTGEFPRESGLLNRVVFADHYHTSFSFLDRDDGSQATWYYVRVTQANGQMAWSSPIWVERA